MNDFKFRRVSIFLCLALLVVAACADGEAVSNSANGANQSEANQSEANQSEANQSEANQSEANQSEACEADSECESLNADYCDEDAPVSVVGICDEGQCRQEVTVGEVCDNICEDGACISAVCEGVTCDTPPQALCDDNRAIIYSDQGLCQDNEGAAECSYPFEYDNCSYRLATCQSGQCQGGITQTGTVTFVEFMARPRGFFGGAGQWFDVVNTSGAPIDLSGWKIEASDGEGGIDVHVIEDPPSFPAGARLLFTGSSDPAGDGSVSPDYQWNRNEVGLPRFQGWFRLVDAQDNIVDLVYLEPGSIMQGHSRVFDPTLDPDAEANDHFANWCPNLTDALGSNGNFGSPGRVPPGCEPEPCSQFECNPPAPYCADDYHRVHVADDVVECQESRFNNPWCDFDRVTEACDTDHFCVNGECLSAPGDLPEPGELVITELMGDPIGPDADREWIEVYNRSDRELSLFSLRLEDNETGAAFDSYYFGDSSLVVGPGQYAVFVRNVDASVNGGIAGGIYYSGNHLKDSPPSNMRIRLIRPDGVIVTDVHYGTPQNGVSQQLSLEVYQNVTTLNAADLLDSANWCVGEQNYGAGGAGTPGQHNHECN